MTITIQGKEYNFDLTGTVGLVYLFQKMTGEMPKDGNAYDQAVLLYCALTTSNPGRKDLPDMMQFIGSLTTSMVKELTEYFWHRWNELEGVATNATVPEDSPSGKEQGED